MRARALLVLTLVALFLLGTTARAQKHAIPPPPAPPSIPTAAPAASPAPASGAPGTTPAPTPDASTEESRKQEAREHFDLGLSHFDNSEWSAALTEFLASRKLFPTRNATKNAAVCLRKEGRFDEALDMWEALLKEFDKTLSPADRQLAITETQQLRNSVGAVDIRDAESGATIVIDGRERGTFPSTPLRVPAGSHQVRVIKDGFAPFEGHVDVAGKQSVIVSAHLGALEQSGRLHVAEQQGRVLDVVVDGAVIGKTPWEGRLAVGDHNVVLRGEGDLGTQPASAPVKLEQVTTLNLLAEPLEATARIDPTPTGASVAVDGVVVGRGLWEGKLRVGGHKVEVAADGFLPFSRDLSLAKGERQVVAAALERDLSSPMWAARNPARFFVEVDGALVISPSLGGDLAAACTGSCSSGLALGGAGVFHGGYQLPSGLGFAIDAGYLSTSETISKRPASVTPVGKPPDSGTANDSITLGGLTIGASASYHRGETWALLLRLGVGVMLGSANDTRTGTFTNSTGVAFPLNGSSAPSATFLYFAPEVRIGRKFGTHFEVNLGVTADILMGLGSAKWQDPQNLFPTSANPGLTSGDGLAGFGSNQAVVGSTIIAILPGLGARYEF